MDTHDVMRTVYFLCFSLSSSSLHTAWPHYQHVCVCVACVLSARVSWLTVIGLGVKTRPQRLTLTSPVLSASTSYKTTHLVPTTSTCPPQLPSLLLYSLYPLDYPFFFQRTTHRNQPPHHPRTCFPLSLPSISYPSPPPLADGLFARHTVQNGSNKIPVTTGATVTVGDQFWGVLA